MTKFFVPYAGDKPAAIMINGHRLVILSRDKESVQGNLEVLGGDNIKELMTPGTKHSDARILNKLARSAGGGIVVAPDEFDIQDVIRNLENQLPWIQ